MEHPDTPVVLKRGCLRTMLYLLAGLCLAGILLTISVGPYISVLPWNFSWHSGDNNIWISSSHTQGSGPFGAGVDTNVSATDLELPIYPGARPHIDDDHSGDGANVWAQFGIGGLKVAAKQFETDDPPEKVLAFYRQALGKFGDVRTCTESSSPDADDEEDAKTIGCDGTHADKGEITLKAGSKRNQHLAAVRPRDERGGSIFVLVAVHVGK